MKINMATVDFLGIITDHKIVDKRIEKSEINLGLSYPETKNDSLVVNISFLSKFKDALLERHAECSTTTRFLIESESRKLNIINFLHDLKPMLYELTFSALQHHLFAHMIYSQGHDFSAPKYFSMNDAKLMIDHVIAGSGMGNN
jgi:hypothetical protein